jgi:lysozyme family protein
MKKTILIGIFCLTIFFSPKIYAETITNPEESTFKMVIDLFKSMLGSSKSQTDSQRNPITNPNITDINQLLNSDNLSETAARFMGNIAACIQNRSVYEVAANSTGVNWQLLAGIHFREGGCNPNSSLVSGRTIGEMEPDITSDCSSDDPNSLTIPINGGCGFRNITDSAIYAGYHLIGKIGRVPSNYADMVRAASRYNGGGNANCGVATPYQYCPVEFEGDDDPYAMSMLDDKHKEMYVIYCEDGVPNTNGCPRLDGNPGVLTATQLVSFASK